jgi:cytochrome c oxidase assembly protein subunit 15
MFWNGMALIKDSKYANGKPWSGLTANGTEAVEKMCQKILADPKVRNFKRLSLALTGLVFVTALSGMCHPFQLHTIH